MTEENLLAGICDRVSRIREQYAGARGKAAFARELNLSPSTYDYYETHRVPPADVLLRISQIANVDIMWLLTGEDAAGADEKASHPTVLRVARLLDSHPELAGAVDGFISVLESLPLGGNGAAAAGMGSAWGSGRNMAADMGGSASGDNAPMDPSAAAAGLAGLAGGPDSAGGAAGAAGVAGGIAALAGGAVGQANMIPNPANPANPAAQATSAVSQGSAGNSVGGAAGADASGLSGEPSAASQAGNNNTDALSRADQSAEAAASPSQAGGPGDSAAAANIVGVNAVRKGPDGDKIATDELVAGVVPRDGFRDRRGEVVGVPVSRGDTPGEHQGWIPVLGRSAAGVPHFWADVPPMPSKGGANSGGNNFTLLADLVAAMKPRRARQVRPARAAGELARNGSAQLVLLDAPEAPGTAEFVIAEHIADEFQDLFALRIDGESMDPEVCHGDVVVLSPHCPAEQGSAAVVQLKDQIGVTCKLVRYDCDRLHLIPVNETFSPTVHNVDSVQWALKVIACIRPV